MWTEEKLNEFLTTTVKNRTAKRRANGIGA